jgi:hypothetical protein
VRDHTSENSAPEPPDNSGAGALRLPNGAGPTRHLAVAVNDCPSLLGIVPVTAQASRTPE